MQVDQLGEVGITRDQRGDVGHSGKGHQELVFRVSGLAAAPSGRDRGSHQHVGVGDSSRRHLWGRGRASSRPHRLDLVHRQRHGGLVVEVRAFRYPCHERAQVGARRLKLPGAQVFVDRPTAMSAGSTLASGTTSTRSPLRPWCRGDELEPRSPDEPAVVRHQRQPKPNRGGGDPPVTVMDLVTKRVTDLPAPLTELGTDADHLVIRLGDGELGDTSFQPPAA